LRQAAAAPRARLDIGCGEPARLWAIAWAADGELRVELESPERVLLHPQTAEGAAAAAAELPEPGTPLYLAFVPF
jgi:hypothetical protein